MLHSQQPSFVDGSWKTNELTSGVWTGVSSVDPRAFVTSLAMFSLRGRDPHWAPPRSRRRLTKFRDSDTRIIQGIYILGSTLGKEAASWRLFRNDECAVRVPLAGLVSFSSDEAFLEVLVGVKAQGRSYGFRVCEEKPKIKCKGTNK